MCLWVRVGVWGGVLKKIFRVYFLDFEFDQGEMHSFVHTVFLLSRLCPFSFFFPLQFKTSQVIRNFVSNALKFTPEGGTVSVRVCFVPTLQKEDNLLVRRKPAEMATLMWFMQKSAKSSPQKSAKSSPVAVDGDVEMAGVHGVTVEQDDIKSNKGMLYISVTDSGAGISTENQKKLFKEIVQFNPEKLQVVSFTFILFYLLNFYFICFYLPVYREAADQGSVCTSARASLICTKGLSLCSRKAKGWVVLSRSSCPCNNPLRRLMIRCCHGVLSQLLLIWTVQDLSGMGLHYLRRK